VHRFAYQGRIDPIQFEVVARTLERRFRFQTPDCSVFEKIRFLECAPDIVGPAPCEVVITIEPFRGRYRVVENGAVIKEIISAQGALEFLHVYLFASSIGDRPQASVLHAACLRRDGRRLLLAGSKGAGKSTLTLQLIRAGYEIEGDEHVFLESAGVIVRPRGCRISEAALPYLADMADIIAAAPCYNEYTSDRIFNLDPRAFGSSWRIEPGRVDHVFVLRPNHGGYSSIRPIRSSALVQFLMSETGWRETDRGISVANIAALAGCAKAFDVSLGDHATAIRCIELATRN
jgi:hypothetical protein